MNLITISKKICRLERSLKIYGTIHYSSDNLFVRTSEMTNVWKKVGNFIITHGHLDQSEEWICLYCWLRTHAMFDIACFHASFGALDIISNVLLILNIFSYSSGIKLSSETLYIYIWCLLRLTLAFIIVCYFPRSEGWPDWRDCYWQRVFGCRVNCLVCVLLQVSDTTQQ